MKKKGRRKNKRSFLGFVFKTIIILMFFFVITFLALVWFKMKSSNYEFIDASNLQINSNLLYELEESKLENVSAKEIKSIRNIMLIGNDAREKVNIGARADTIMILSVNPVKKSIKLISLPRDTYVNIPGRGMDKLNHAYAYGREKLLMSTINSNFNLNLEDYITINFRGLIELINEIGGVNLNITESERIYINDRSMESYSLTNKPYKAVKNSGNVLLDGEQTLTHARNRTIGNDFIRQERQRQIIAEVIKELKNLDLGEIVGVIKQCLKHVSTNINIFEYMKIIPSIVAHKEEYSNNIISTQIPSVNYSSGRKIRGVYYFVTNKSRAISDFAEYIYNK